jgi:glyoxylase-like metal-dependent hydrolase (beta-lactamase superfamily II)
MIAEIRRITPKPVQYVVNTHWHNDHVAGNGDFSEAFPNAKFIAHEFTAGMLESDVKPFFGDRCASFLRSQTRDLRETLKSNRRASGEPLSTEQRARLERMLVEADVGIEECAEFSYRGADLSFADSLRIDLGRREVRVLWLGRANTAGDALVHVPDAGVLATGDIVVHPFPFATQSFLTDWVRVLRTLETFDAPILVPGHGPVMRDRAYVATLGELFESVMTQARAAYRPGMSADELRKAIDVSKLRDRIAGSDRFIAVNFDAMVLGSGVDRAWQELRGAFEPEAMPRE